MSCFEASAINFAHYNKIHLTTGQKNRIEFVIGHFVVVNMLAFYTYENRGRALEYKDPAFFLCLASLLPIDVLLTL